MAGATYQSRQPRSPWLTARPKSARKACAKGRRAIRTTEPTLNHATGGRMVSIGLKLPARTTRARSCVRNLSDVGKREGIERVEAALEPDLLYPLVRGRDVGRWRMESSAQLLNVQDAMERQGYDEEWLKSKLPLTYTFLLKFEKLLRQRSGFRKYFCNERGKPFAPFYSLYNIGEIYACTAQGVLAGTGGLFHLCRQRERQNRGQEQSRHSRPQVDVRPLQDREEAHFVCAMLSSSISVLVVKSYGLETQTSTHVLSMSDCLSMMRRKKRTSGWRN